MDWPKSWIGQKVHLSFSFSLMAQTMKHPSTCNARDPGLIPGSGRSPGEGNGYVLQYSYLKNSMDRGAWQTSVHLFIVRHNWAANTFTLFFNILWKNPNEHFDQPNNWRILNFINSLWEVWLFHNPSPFNPDLYTVGISWDLILYFPDDM